MDQKSNKYFKELMKELGRKKYTKHTLNTLKMKLCEKHKLNDYVGFIGMREDVPALLSRSDIVCVPSTYNDPLPRAVLEGMAAGKPVVASNVGGIPEMVIDQVTGLLVNPRDPKPIANALVKLMEDRKKSIHMGKQGRKVVREKFDNDEPIADLKRGITMRFGDRGRNICNLCTAKYFEEFLIPLFNADKEPFDNIYEDLIKNSMLAVFVNQSMEVDDIPGEIKKKIAISKKYGFNFIHIHGIGQTNIDTIKKFIDSEKINLFNIVKIIYSNPKEHILVVELLFS